MKPGQVHQSLVWGYVLYSHLIEGFQYAQYAHMVTNHYLYPLLSLPDLNFTASQDHLGWSHTGIA